MKSRSFVVALLVAVLTLGFPVMARGAGSDATVQGVVSSSGGPLAAATVKVEYLAKGGLPKRTAFLTTEADGAWSYAGRAGDYRLTFTAEGYYTSAVVVHLEAKQQYTQDVLLSPVPPPMGTITGRITSGLGYGISGYAYFFKQNADGTWPTGYLAWVATATDGTYSSGLLPLGVYKVRLFTVHNGVQWYRYASTIESATPVVLETDGQVVSGVDAQYPPPAP